ncbi:MAG: hypothetical protein ACOC7V_06765 [Spirochaetota bacterium]
MMPRRLLAALCLSLVPLSAFALGFEALTLGFSEAWTGNAYVPDPNDPDGPYDFDVTGSEPMPIDAFATIGVRFGLLGGLPASSSVLSVSPSLAAGARRYVLFESGIVAPAQVETATGAEADTLARGSARVVTLRLAVPIAYEYRFAGGDALFMGVSPTGVARVVAGATVVRDKDTDLSGMYAFFYDRLRYLMPEVSLGYRIAISDALEATIHATAGISVLDLFVDTSMPWYDQTRIAVGIDLGLRPPFSALARAREGELPAGIAPFPEPEDAR